MMATTRSHVMNYAPPATWIDRLGGQLFTSARGYDGVGVGNSIYSIGTYGSWPWQSGTQAEMWTNTDHWKVSSYVGQHPQAVYLATGRGFR
jgi:hypothetical protein